MSKVDNIESEDNKRWEDIRSCSLLSEENMTFIPLFLDYCQKSGDERFESWSASKDVIAKVSVSHIPTISNGIFQ